jgi:hypothetical protein
MGASRQLEKIWVRWPGGRVDKIDVPDRASEITVSFDGRITTQ